MIARPDPSEYAAFYHTYVGAVPEGDVLETLRRSGDETQALLAAVGEEGAGHRYAPGKWSVRQVAGHLADTERIMSYRALRGARGDRTPLASFDENDYAEAGGFDRRSRASLAAELAHVRAATLDLFGNLDDEALVRRTVANGAEVSVRALAWIVAGHEMHHRRILRERYGVEG